MLVTLKEILKIAEERNIAIGAFNAPNMPTVRAVIGAAEELNQPVIIMHIPIHEEMGLCKMEEMAPLMLTFAKNAKVPVCVHLDHGSDVNEVLKGIELGFTSVMYDGSNLTTEKNIVNTKIVVEAARKTGCSVEAEIGSMGAREGTGEKAKSIYTDPVIATYFVNQTGIDALACAFGTAHGFYKDVPKLDFELLSAIKYYVDIPIVMHGGSGVSENDYREVIKRGVRKINYYTYMSKEGAAAVANKEYTQFHDIVADAEKAMKENAKKAIKIFSNIKEN